MQHLNLYDPSLRPERRLLTLPVALLLLGLLLLAMVLGVALLQRASQQQMLRVGQAESQIKVLGALPQAQVDAAEAAQLQALRERLVQAQAFERQLQTLPPSEAALQLLEGLALAAGPDVWLTAARWDAREPALELQGRLLDSRQLPVYLRRLEQQAAFRGQRFSQLSLQPVPEGSQHQFLLRSGRGATK